MVYKISTLFLLLAVSIFHSNSQPLKTGCFNRIIIEAEMPVDYRSRLLPNSRITDSVDLSTIELNTMEFFPMWKHEKVKVSNKKVKWVLLSEQPLLIMCPLWGFPAIINPGDSISIKSENGFTCLGKGAEGLILQFQINFERNKVVNPVKNIHDITSLQEYLAFNQYLNRQLELTIPKMNSYRKKIPDYSLLLIKTKTIYDIEYLRSRAFWAFFTNGKKVSTLQPSDMANIHDSTMNGSWAKWLRSHSDYCNMIWYFDSYHKLILLKKNKFSFRSDSSSKRVERNILYYTSIKQNFKGLIRERLLQYLVAYEIVKKTGFNEPTTDSILNDYYLQPGFEKYKTWMRNYVNTLDIKDGQRAPKFSLTDENGNVFSESKIKGKVSLLYFWNSDCKKCIELIPILNKVQNEFKEDSNVVILSVSGDKNSVRGKERISNETLSKGKVINLSTGNNGKSHPVLKTYFVNKYPKLYLLNKDGKIYEQQVADLSKNDGKPLISLIKEHVWDIVKDNHALINDGPYVLYNNDSLSVYNISNNHVTISQISKGVHPEINVQTDIQGQSFNVKLKSRLDPEPSEYAKPKKLFVFSDIEGNFEAMRMLLQSNKIIDEHYNWIFGNGHLVFLGDMFDRGLQVAECLWLVYYLEEKAKAAGGYVHFILGNHEIMNFNNDLRYMRDKYKTSCSLLGIDYMKLYGKNSELGRWLRTKNIVEKIGDMIFVHGGLSPAVNRLPLNINQLNEISRTHYSGRTDFTDPQLNILFDVKTSPFWFRGYYEDRDRLKQIPTIQQVDSSLQKFNAGYIITGHTIVGDTVSLWYNNKIINIDTKHSQGASEALLIDENNYYRVNSKGSRILLFKSEEYYYSVK